MKWIVFENPKGTFWIRPGLPEQGLKGDADLGEYVEKEWDARLSEMGQWASKAGPFATAEIARAEADARRDDS